MTPKKVGDTEIEKVIDEIKDKVILEALSNSLRELGESLPSDFSVVYKGSELGLLISVEGTDNNLFVSYRELEIYVRDTVQIIGEVDKEYLLETVEDILREDIVRWMVGSKENVFTQRV